MAFLRALPVTSLLMFFALPALPDMTEPVIPEITLTADDGMLRIEGHVASLSAQEVVASLSVIHRGSGGSLNTAQSSTLNLEPGIRARVATTGINFGPGSELEVELTVAKGGSIVARTRTEIGGSN